MVHILVGLVPDFCVLGCAMLYPWVAVLESRNDWLSVRSKAHGDRRMHSTSLLGNFVGRGALFWNFVYIAPNSFVKDQRNTHRCQPFFQPFQGFDRMTYSIGDRIHRIAPHHASIEALWETKWKKPVSCVVLRKRVL